MDINTTKYYDEFLRYFEMAKWQHENCNLGNTPHIETPYDDDLIKHVHLYDVVERRYAGFTKLLNDLWSQRQDWSRETWLYVFFVHRLTGSGINYASKNSGYHNSVLLHFGSCFGIADMVEVIRDFKGPKFTSSGYQIAPFPKPNGAYERGGDWFMCEVLPDMVKRFNQELKGQSFRELMSWLEAFNKERGFRVFRFQYGAVLADIADFFPDCIDISSYYFYGKNAIECLEYFAKNDTNLPKLEFLDRVMDKITLDTGSLPYNAEDVACDAIRWIENYINPKSDYSHLCLDTIWSSHTLHDHPYGRQRMMLKLKLVDTFNGNPHPSDNKIIASNKLSPDEYRTMVRKHLDESFLQ